jgi:hypothetical protein
MKPYFIASFFVLNSNKAIMKGIRDKKASGESEILGYERKIKKELKRVNNNFLFSMIMLLILNISFLNKLYNFNMEIFKNKYNKLVLVITVLSLILLIGFPVYQFYDFIVHSKIKTSNLIISVILIFIPIFSWLFSVGEYVLESDGLSIKRKIFPIKIKYEEIKKVSRLGYQDIKSSIRIFGNGGLFGFYGIFRNESIGNYRAYFSNFSDLVLIETDKKKFVISPENPDIFTDYLKSRIKN